MPRWWLSVWPFLPALLAPLGVLDSTDELAIGAYAINALLVIIATPLVVAVHECGHALVGALLGGRVARIQIGSGRRLAGTHVAGISVQLCATPAGGMTWISPAEGHLPRLREWLWTAAGPLADLGLIAMLITVSRPEAPPRWLIGEGLASQVAPLQVIAMVAALQLVYQVLYLSADGDLAQLVRLPFRRAAALSPGGAEIDALCAEGREDDAVRRAHDILSEREDPSLRLWLAELYLTRHQPVAARDVIEPALASGGTLSIDERHELEATRAWILIFLDEAAAANEAVRVAAGLHREYPNRPWITGIHGAALVAAGRLDEGVALLRASYDENLDDGIRAHDAAWLALAATRRGRLEEASHWHAEAIRLDEHCYSLPLLESVSAPGE